MLNLKIFSMKIKAIKCALIIVAFFFVSFSFAETKKIPQESYTVHYVSSQLAAKPIANAFDNSSSSYWALKNWAWFPGIVAVDLGEEKAINGLSYLPNGKSGSTRRSKATYFEVYVTSDTLNWGEPQIASMFVWADADDAERQDVYFGATTGRYVKVAYLSNYHHFIDLETDNRNVHTNDLYFYEDTEGATSKKNQLITIDEYEATGVSADPFELTASSSSGEVVQFEMVSGPATVDGTTCTLTGEEGIVTIKASVTGNDTYYESENYLSFHVLNTSVFEPVLKTSLSSDFPIYMTEFKPFPISFFVDGLPDYVSIDSAFLVIDNNELEIKEINGGYIAHWLPKNYGFHAVQMKVYASNGNTAEKVLAVQLMQQAPNLTVTTLNKAPINTKDGTTYTGSYSLPQFVGAFNQIIGHLSLTYPESGGDDYDRVSRIWARSNNSPWIEIIRYITPYYTECDHTIDLTDYASLLQGNVEIMAWVETWNGEGFEFTLDLEYLAGEPEYSYSKVTQLWNGRYNFGNYENLQPVSNKNVVIDTNVVEAQINLVTTGHGWSNPDVGHVNTGNAAEFMEAKHHLIVNDNTSFEQHLWNTCNPNPDGCSPQRGTWQYPRAGWCPGAIASVFTYDITDLFSADDDVAETLKIDYRFQEDYVDMCHPKYPDCVTGENDCVDCNNGMNPNYIVSGNLITFLNEPSASDETTVFIPERPIDLLNFKVYPTVSCGELFVDATFNEQEIAVEVIGINGAVYRNYIFNDSYELNNYTFELSDLNGGFYVVRITTAKGHGVQKFILE